MLNRLSLDNLKRITPSIFITESAAGTSDKYKHISTIEVVQDLMKDGFMPVKATQNHTGRHRRFADAVYFSSIHVVNDMATMRYTYNWI